MNRQTQFADKLSSIVNDIVKDIETPSELTADGELLSISSIKSFIEKIRQQSSGRELSATDIVHGLNLKCHPEGGFYRRFSWTKEKTKTFYLLPAGCLSSWHRLNGIRETLKWMYGGTLMVPQIANDSGWLAEAEVANDKVVVIEEGYGWGNWFGAYNKDETFTLVVCECTPPFEFSNFELANEKHFILFAQLNPLHVEKIELLSKTG